MGPSSELPNWKENEMISGVTDDNTLRSLIVDITEQVEAMKS